MSEENENEEEFEIEIIEEQEAGAPDDDEIDAYLSDVQERGGKKKPNRTQKRIEKLVADKKKLYGEVNELRRTEETAIQYAQRVARENEELKRKMQEAQSGSFAAQHNSVRSEVGRFEAEVQAASAAFQDAHEEGDSKAMTAAQTRLAEAQANLVNARREAKKYDDYSERMKNAPKAEPEPKKEEVVQQPQRQPAPKVDKRVEQWVSKNDWFDPQETGSGDADMTDYAIMTHRQLLRKGHDPENEPDDYYKALDQSMRKAFPDYFENTEEDDEDDSVEVEVEKPRKKPTRPPVGAPTRGAKPSKKIQLTASQAALAKRIGVPLEEYAKSLKKEMNHG